MASTQLIAVTSTEDLKSRMLQYASSGFTALHSDERSVTLSRKKPFNWVVAIICLFIPIVGWIALLFMIMAAGRGSEVVEIKVV